MARAPTRPDRATARQKLEELWEIALCDDSAQVSSGIRELVNSEQTSIRFCLPTQLLGKLIDPSLDTLCLQRGDGTDGRWDPRSFAAKVIVPWNQNNQRVLGPSSDPYVSNPLRRPRVDDGLQQMSDRDEWEKLCDVLREVEAKGDLAYTEHVLSEVLVAIRDRLRELSFVYVVPPRVSLRQAESLTQGFLAESSGGDRGLAIVAAVFESIRERLGIYHAIRRSVINAADAATNSAGDLECVGADGRIILAVEVKERRIGDADVHAAIAKAREFLVREVLLCTQGVLQADRDAVERSFDNAWASGTSLYHMTIGELIRGTLPLLGEEGIRAFVMQVGSQLDKFSTQPRHRRAWKALLDNL